MSRPRVHLSKKTYNAENFLHVYRWIRSLVSRGSLPEIIIIEEGHSSFEELLDAEVFWISYFKSMGCHLTNLTAGGEGCLGYKHTEEARKKISKATRWNAGKKLSQELCERISRGQMGHTRTKGIKRSEEFKKRVSQGLMGHRSWSKGQKHSEETKKKISEANILRWKSRKKLTLD